MPRITTVDLAEARNRLRDRTPGYAARAPYREAIANLADTRMLELELDPGESTTGELEVWLREKPRQKRGPRKPRSA